MARRFSQLPLPQRLLPAAILIVAILGLLPARYIGWVGWFRSPLLTLVAPISGPLHAVASWLRPAEPNLDTDAVRVLREERDLYQQMYLQKDAEVARLSGVIAALQQFRAANPSLQTRISRPVIATASDLASGVLAVRIGGEDGITSSSIATIRGVQLLGRVTKVDARLCYIMPITQKAAGLIGTRVYLSGHGSAAPISLPAILKPLGDGTLSGDVAYEVNKSTLTPYTPQVGDRVLLDDTLTWPAAAQHTLIGEVIVSEPSQGKPGRTTIVVRPAIPQLERIADVMLITSAEDDPAVEGSRK